MVANHRPSIMVITETKVGGERAEKIIEGFPFDGFITTDTIGYAGGLWILWNKGVRKFLCWRIRSRRYMLLLRYMLQTFLDYFLLFILVLIWLKDEYRGLILRRWVSCTQCHGL